MPRSPSQHSMQSDISGMRILIAGPQRFQNELISFYLTQETGTTCATKDTFDFNDWNKEPSGELPQIVLVDIKSDSTVSLIENWLLRDDVNDKPMLVLFNANREYDLQEALWAGVQGVFFDNEPLEIFAQGLRAICRGELWFPRKVIANCLRMVKNEMALGSIKENVKLTDREEEILALLANGEDNKGISDKLFISYHTVKTHLYKIFKKLGTTNRVQAALWARRNLRQPN